MTLLWAGCVPLSDQVVAPTEVRSIYVREAAGATSDELRRCGEVAHDAAVRRLEAMGYRAAPEEKEADATLEGRWEIAADGPASARQVVGLSLVLRARAGGVLFSTQVVPGTPLNFLSQDRVREDVGSKLTPLGRPPYGR
jgi:hypothetical protein